MKNTVLSASYVDYKKLRLAPLFTISHFDSIQYFEFKKDFVSEVESHDSWEFIYIDKGSICEKIGDKTIILNKGEYIMIKPYEDHQLSSANDTSPNVFIMGFICNSRAMTVFRNHYGTLPENLRPFIAEIMKETRQTFDVPFNDPLNVELVIRNIEPPGGQQLIHSYTIMLLIQLYRDIIRYEHHQIFNLPDKITGSENEIINSLISYIRTNVYESLSVKMLCDHIGYSQCYLSTLFRKNTGMTVVEYINEVKISEAKSLIRLGSYTITEISGLLKYSNQHYFSRVFRRITGMSPSEYKNRIPL